MLGSSCRYRLSLAEGFGCTEAIINQLFADSCQNSYQVLAGVAQWIECWPENQRVTGLIPSQGICLGWARSPVGGA